MATKCATHAMPYIVRIWKIAKLKVLSHWNVCQLPIQRIQCECSRLTQCAWFMWYLMSIISLSWLNPKTDINQPLKLAQVTSWNIAARFWGDPTLLQYGRAKPPWITLPTSWPWHLTMQHRLHSYLLCMLQTASAAPCHICHCKQPSASSKAISVSYTHLTLPTILRV